MNDLLLSVVAACLFACGCLICRDRTQSELIRKAKLVIKAQEELIAVQDKRIDNLNLHIAVLSEHIAILER